MIRKIIKFNNDLCDGCGLCVKACHEGAIAVIDGKAKLIRDDYCDGLGNCLPVCPAGAICFEEREAAAFNDEAVKANFSRMKKAAEDSETPACGCPGAMPRSIKSRSDAVDSDANDVPAELHQWPIQIKLVPVNAQYFNDADLLIAADCAAYACGNFHRQYMKGKITIIGCPKLDNIDYTDKLAEIIAVNSIRSVTVVKMEVPCCAGIERAAANAVKSTGKTIPLNVVTLKIN
ncbi:MAG: 4Fe-4S binding protein [Treponema sp.]|nr:4Fe-4S binding protein [Treponema sp.]